ncbi:hypothetical protein OAA60_05500 [Porticoccaceae bacterium]|nr:hypothetical protein [Porticoccaceae bacterium]
MSEEKPRIKVEYVEVSWNCYSELFVMLENNEVLATALGVELTIVSLAMCIEQGKEVYRKVETEIKTEKRWVVYDKNGGFYAHRQLEPVCDDSYQLFEIEVEV